MIVKKPLFSIFSTFVKSEIYTFKSLQKNLTRVDYKVMLVCIVTALSLTCTYYFGDYRFFVSLLRNLEFIQLPQVIEKLMTAHPDAGLYRALYWASVVIFFYLIFPVLCIKLIFKERFSDYGLSFKNAFKYYQLYIWMLIIMVPLVIYFSAAESFQAMYPFYKTPQGESLYPKFFIWEFFYCLQFFALEFFFRGFILHGTKHRFGFYAIFFMTVPYCMIHFGKPMPETIAAIIAGIVLGFMSLKSKNIWMGVFIHCSVALMMDFSALFRKGLLGNQSDFL